MQVLVLAGSRGGSDPLAQHAGVSQKCLAAVAGRPMVERVAETILSLDGVVRLRIAAQKPSELEDLPVIANECRVTLTGCEPTPSLTVAAHLHEAGAPMLVTTADHPLLTREMLTHFIDRATTSDADIAVGLVSSTVILQDYPDNRRTYLKFRDGRFSGANLFWLGNDRARNAVRFWRRVEQDRKKPWRIAMAMGPGLLVSYLLRRLSLDEAMQKASQRVGAQARAVLLPFAEAAIDVDKVDDLLLADAILERRQAP
ncbi:MAG: NTP transferase domain-containing protein [Geminicoccaceae bacterium]|nr:NTP transferase domain-containing protein [Geminicoccaceae bacterium]